MLLQLLIFALALTALLFSAKIFTQSAEKIGVFFKMPSFVIGIFIVGIGTSLPELVSGSLSVLRQHSEIAVGNIVGANVSNLLLVTGLGIVLRRKSIELGSNYIFIDLHYLIGSFVVFGIMAYDGRIVFAEAFMGLIIFAVYSVYLLKSDIGTTEENSSKTNPKFPWKACLLLLGALVGIYFGADYTIHSLSNIAKSLGIPSSIIALTLLSLGTTLPELSVNLTCIKQGKAEMAVGNVLGSCVFNCLVIPGIATLFGPIQVPQNIVYFSLPLMLIFGVLFYLLTQDKRMSPWEGALFVCLYVFFVVKTISF
jgi:cation:H+ antiporter